MILDLDFLQPCVSGVVVRGHTLGSAGNLRAQPKIGYGLNE